jgi:hypothetical protein
MSLELNAQTNCDQTQPSQSMPKSNIFNFGQSSQRQQPEPSTASTLVGQPQMLLESSANVNLHQSVEANSVASIVPPPAPSQFTRSQQIQFKTGYRLRALDAALRNHIIQAASFSSDDHVLQFHEAKKNEIFEAAGLTNFMTISHMKRKSHNHEADTPSKRANIHGLMTNGIGSSRPLFENSPASNKRKADDDNANENNGSGKKARGEESSKTRQAFATLISDSASSKTSPSKATSSSSDLSSNKAASEIFPGSKPNSSFVPMSNQPSNIFMEKTAKEASSTFKVSTLLQDPLVTNVPGNNMSNLIPGTTSVETLKASGLVAPKFGSGSGSDTGNSSASGPPKFNITPGVDFLAQFGQAAKKTEASEKAKRKAEDFDSDDETEAEWEARYETEKAAKKRKIEETSKSDAHKFRIGKSGSDKSSDRASPSLQPIVPGSTSSGLFGNISPSLSATSGESIFATLKAPGSGTSTPFSFKSLSQPGSDAESKTGDADNEESEESDEDGPDDKVSMPAGRSMFDMIEYDADGNPKREIPPGAEKAIPKANPLSQSSAVFGQAAAAQKPGYSFATANVGTPLFGSSKASPTNSANASQPESLAGDRTWKPDSPIKFGGSSTAPSLSFTAPSPEKMGQASLTGIFGSAQPNSVPVVNPFAKLSGNSTPSSTGSVVGFDFGGPSKATSSSLAPIFASANTSRATSPGATTGDSATESAVDDEPAQKDDQLDFLASRTGEEDEDVLFKTRAKAREYAILRGGDKKEWITRGVGQLRVLKHRESKKTRIVMRTGPAGKIILNTALMSEMDYKVSGERAVLFGIVTDEGKLNQWMISVGTKEEATQLSTLLQENKAN